MATKRDYYEILGVNKSANDDEIKKAYRAQALKHHPDRDKTLGATERFKEINEAYEVLSNSQKRSAYDQYGHAAFEPGGMGQGSPFSGGYGGQGGTYQQGPFTYTYYTSGGGGGGQPFEGMGGFTDPFEIFEQFFGGGFSSGRRKRKPQYSIEITFEEAVHGAQKEVEINGKRIKIKIPAGVDTGSRIRFDDFDLVTEVRPDKNYKRDGNDLYIDKEISFTQAILGSVVSVPTIDGTVDLKIQPGTKPNTMIRLRERGVPFVRGGGRGDQYVRIIINFPSKITQRQKDLLEQFEQEGKTKRGWF